MHPTRSPSRGRGATQREARAAELHLRPAAACLLFVAAIGCTPIGALDAEALELQGPTDVRWPADEVTPDASGEARGEEDTGPIPTPESIGLGRVPRSPCDASGEPTEPVEVDEPGAEGKAMLAAKLADGRWVGLPLQHTSFDTIVTGTVAETVVTQRFGNPLDVPIEAIYTFPLPDNGAVDDYWMRVADRHVRGKLLKRQDAREAYEKAKAAGHSTGLMEQERPNVFTQSVANIPPGATIQIGMHIVQPLRPDRGVYSLALPTVVAPRYAPGTAIGHGGSGWAPDTTAVPDASRLSPPVLGGEYRTCGDLEITVAIDSGVPVQDLRARSHAIEVDHDPDGAIVTLDEQYALLNRDFVLSWRLADTHPRAVLMADPDTDGNGGWFTLTVVPPKMVAEDEAVRREIVFVVDASGSMHGAPMDAAKAAMRKFVSGLREGDSFQILRFSEDASGLGPQMLEHTDDNVEAGLRYIDALSGQGGTEMTEGIKAALALPRDRSRMRYVVFLTDGLIGNEREIFKLVDDRIGDTRLFALGVGQAPNRYLLDGLARMGAGAVHYVGIDERAAPVVDRLYEQLRTSALTDLSVEFDGIGVRSLLPARLPDLFVGQPVVVFGRYEGALSGKATVHGRNGEGPVEIPVEIREGDAERVDGLQSMWARTKIEDVLFDPKSIQSAGGIHEAARDRVIDLSLKHRVLTEFTAFVAVDAAATVTGAGTDITIVQATDLAEGLVHEYVFGEVAAVGPVASDTTLGLGNVGAIGHGGGGGTGSGYGHGAGAGFGGRGARTPRVRQAKAIVVSGSLDRFVIRRIVRNHINEVRHCYNDALSRDPAVAGRVVLQFIIDAHGKVTAAVVQESAIDDAVFRLCIARAVKRWTFPTAPDQSGAAIVTYPFVFAPS